MQEKMIIKVNEAGMNALHQLIDITLKFGGIQNLQGVQNILASIELLKEPVKNKPKPLKK